MIPNFMVQNHNLPNYAKLGTTDAFSAIFFKQYSVELRIKGGSN